MAIGRKKIAEAVRAFAAECAAGTAPELGNDFHSGCAMQRVAERIESRGFDVGMEICGMGAAAASACTAVYHANDAAPPGARAAAVVAPLNALADELESAP